MAIFQFLPPFLLTIIKLKKPKLLKKKKKSFTNILQGLGPGTSKGTGVGQPGHLAGVGIKQWVRFHLGELVGYWGRWGPRETNRALRHVMTSCVLR